MMENANPGLDFERPILEIEAQLRQCADRSPSVENDGDSGIASAVE